VIDGIRIYLEGGGDHRDSRAALRRGFGEFLKSLREKARRSGMRWDIIACGSRRFAYDAFCNAVRSNRSSYCILLVDSESPVSQTPWKHLQTIDNWIPPGVGDEHCQLMVRTMETWLIADLRALEKFYGQDFNGNRIPATENIESIEKETLEEALKEATRRTQKGEYHKIRHGPRILEMLDSAMVCGKAFHCSRLFDTVNKVLDGEPA
jgi:hypothetical protein